MAPLFKLLLAMLTLDCQLEVRETLSLIRLSAYAPGEAEDDSPGVWFLPLTWGPEWEFWLCPRADTVAFGKQTSR